MKALTLLRLVFCGLLLLAQIKVQESSNPLAKFCDNMDLSTFCLIGNHFRQVNYDENRRTMKFPQYAHFRQIVETFFPPIWDVSKDGAVEPWPWIQDNWDDIEYSVSIKELMVEAREIVRIQPPKDASQIPKRGPATGIWTQGYRYNLYSVFDLCALDKIYSPVYKLFTDYNEIPLPKNVEHSKSPGAKVIAPVTDYRLHYACGGQAAFNHKGSTPAIPYKPAVPAVPASPGVPAVPAIPEQPYVPRITPEVETACRAASPSPTPWLGQEAFEFGLENPFEVKVTEIKANGRRLNNHLHFEIGFKGGKLPTTMSRSPAPPNLPPPRTGPAYPPAKPKPIDRRISYAFIIVHDQDGSPVGDFNTGVPCGKCGGKCIKDAATDPDICHQGRTRDSIPCMIVSKDAVTHPGQMMMYFAEPVSSIHVTWRFAQSTSTRAFTKEIHIKTLLVLEGAENEPMVMVRDGRVDYKKSNLDKLYKYYDCSDSNFKESLQSADPELGIPTPTSPVPPTEKVQSDHCYRHTPKYGIFGWNAKYPILYPTELTLGAWDYFPKRFIHEADVECHVPLNTSYYASEPYPTYGLSEFPTDPKWDPIRDGQPKWSPKAGDGPSLIMGSKSEVYQGLTLEQPSYYRGLIDEESLTLINKRELDPQKYLPKRRPVKTSIKAYTNTMQFLRRLKSLEDMQEDERCRCARFGTIAPPPAEKVPEIGQLEGRRDHAIQMVIAWIALVPFGIFVSRYYKETYAKVFFLQEFWWYTIHVLTFMLALVFNGGGIYGIHIKRSEPFNWLDKTQMIHALLGWTSILIFTLHLLLGIFRLKSPKRRRFQICLHWFFGFANYLLALGCMTSAAFVKSGCMGCITLILVASWLGIQIIMYIIMEIHMRLSDKQLHLNPPRSYLPPPVMRLFHKNAPGAKFRIVMLVIFGIFSTGFYAGMHYTIESGGPAFRSCFNYDEELEAIQKQYIKLVDE